MIDLKNVYEIRNVINNKVIEKIEDDLGNIIYENFRELIASGVPPITLQKCKNADLVDYKIYGESVQDGTPTPETPIEVESVGDYDLETGKYKIPVKVSGKNKFDINNVNLGAINQSALNRPPKIENNIIYSGGVYGSTEGACLYIDTLGENDWTISFNANFEDTETTRNYRIYRFNEFKETGLIDSANRLGLYKVNEYTTTTVDTTGYRYVGIVFFSVNQYGIEITNLQFERGTTPTNYEPYTEPITTNIYLDKPLRKMGDCADYIDFKNQKVFRNIIEGTLTGNISWSTSGTRFYYSNSNLNIKCLGTDVKCIMSNTLKGTTWNLIRNSGTGIGIYTDNRVDVRADGIWSTADDVKAYLSENPITYIALALNPTEEEVELPNILLNKRTNIIETDTTIPSSYMETVYYGKGKLEKLNETENIVLNDILGTETETELDITDTEINQILDEIIGG